MGGMVLSDAAPLVANLDPTAPEGDDEVAVEDFRVAPQARAETGVGAYSIPPLASTEPTDRKSVV